MTQTPSLPTPEPNLAPFAGRAAWAFALVGAAVTLSFTAAFLATAFITTSGTGRLALSIDFRVFWAAARLALSGEPLAVLDIARLTAEHGVSGEGRMPWLYAPGALLLVTPLGELSFAAAYAVWTALSLLLLALAWRPFAPTSPLWLAMTTAPALLPSLCVGQTSLLWLAGLLAALAALQTQRWMVAGIFIGCLTLKPQLGLMIPIALVAAGAWRTILAASLTTILLAGLPTLFYGAEYWPRLLTLIADQGRIMMAQIGSLELMVGPLSLMTQLGLPPGIALKLQWLITGATALALFLLWRSNRVVPDAKAAGLLTVMLLSAPYLWYYEAALMPAIGLFLLRAGILTTRPLRLLLFLFLWLGAGLQAMNVFLGFTSQSMIGAVIVTPALFTSLALCLIHLAAAHRAATQQETQCPR